jgi:hypothetical protein
MQLKEAFERNVVPFGLLELDAAGTVLYYRPDGQEDEDMDASTLVGRNLLTEVVPINDAREFRDRLYSFRWGDAPADSFNFTFCLEEGCVLVKVLLAHIREQTEAGAGGSILMHIRKG